MRKILVATAAAIILSGGALLASRAEAITLAAPAGARIAIEQTAAVQQVRRYCYRVWRHGHWRRKCDSHRARVRHRYYGYPYYYGYRPRYYASRPYYYGYRPHYRYPYAYRRPSIGFYFRF